MRDMFEHLDEVPQNVLDVLKAFEESENDYDQCAQLVASLIEVGWYCEYYLDAEPYNLRPLSVFDTWTMEEVDKIFNYHLDDMHPLDAVRIRKEVRTYDEKIVFFIDEEEKFKKYLES